MIMKYLKYELKRSFWPIIILTIFGILIYIPRLLTIDTSGYQSTYLENIFIFLTLICIATPIYEFSFLQKKRSIDNYYSLPVKRSSIIGFKFFCGFIKILISYTIVFFLGFLIVVLKQSNFNLVSYIPYYLLSVLLGLSLYSYISFIYTRANTIIDGIIFITFYLLIFLFLFQVLGEILHDLFNITSSPFYYPTYPITPLQNLTYLYSNKIKYRNIIEFTDDFYISKLLNYIMWSIIGLASMVGLYFSPKFDKAERAEQISDSYFGYRILLPFISVFMLYAFDLNPFLDFYNFISLTLFIAVILVLYIVYQRTFKLHLKNWLILGSSIIIGILLAVIK